MEQAPLLINEENLGMETPYKRNWTRFLLSSMFLIIFSSMLSSRMIYQEAMLGFVFCPSGAILRGLQYNQTIQGFVPSRSKHICNGLFDCTEKICTMWVQDPNAYYIGWQGAGPCPGIGDFNLVIRALFEQNAVVLIFLGGCLLSPILLLISHLILKPYSKKIVESIYLLARLLIPMAFVLNEISVSQNRYRSLDWPPGYLIFWEWWEVGLSLVIYIAESMIYLLS